MEQTRKNRVELSIKQQMEISEKLEEGVKFDQLTSEYNIDKSTIYRIKKRSIKMAQFADENLIGKKKRMRKPMNKELEDRLYSWYVQRRVLGDAVTSDVLREKALQLNSELGGPSSFSASRSWIIKFKKRRGIHRSNDQEEKDDDEESPLLVDSAGKLKEIIAARRVDLENVYHMDETGLAWRCLPRVALATLEQREEHQGEEIKVEKVKKERVTVALCANATGTHRLPVLFINKHETPRALKHCRDRIPVLYRFQKDALMDVKIFKDWYRKEFKPSVEGRQIKNGTWGKVLLLVSNHWARKLPEDLLESDKFSIMFLPSSKTFTLSPMNQGVMQKVKRSFRFRLLRQILKFDGNVAEFYFDYDVKDCMDLLHEAWGDVDEFDVKNAWLELLGNFDDLADNKEPPFYQNLQELITAILGQEVKISEVEDWLAACADVEKSVEESEESIKNNQQQRPNDAPNVEEDEVDRMFRYLIAWSNDEPEFVQLQVQCLKIYYDQK